MSPEEIAFDFGYISDTQLLAAADRLGKSDYAAFLRRRASEGPTLRDGSYLPAQREIE